MSLVVMGTSHKSAPLEVRELVGVAPQQVGGTLAELVGNDNVREALVLSTCNRVEVYVDAKTDRLGATACAVYFARRAGGAYDPSHYYLHRGMDAVGHVLRVVCSLDSQVLGEAQILGQVKRAFSDAVEHGTCGEVLTKLMKTAIQLGKRVRSETGIGSDSVSLSTTAFKAASGNVEEIAACKALVVGAGEMARLMATYLRDAGTRDVTVVSRTLAHAQKLAQDFGFAAAPFEERYAIAARADVVFTMTSSEEPVIEARALAAAREAACTEGERLVLVDEAVPRDVEPACAELDAVVLVDLEVLGSVVDDGLAHRLKAVSEVERMVERAQQEFLTWMQERLVVPTVKSIYEKGELVVADELVRAQRAMEKALGHSVDEDELQVLAAYGNAVMKKILHGPVMRLRREAKSPDSYYYTGAARYLFGLDVFPPGTQLPCAQRACEHGGDCPVGLPDALWAFCNAQGRGQTA